MCEASSAKCCTRAGYGLAARACVRPWGMLTSKAVSCTCCVCACRPHLPGVRFVAGGNPADAAFQLKSLVKALHAAGIEVLLEVSTTVDRSTAQYLRMFVYVLDRAHARCAITVRCHESVRALRVLSKLFVPVTMQCLCVVECKTELIADGVGLCGSAAMLCPKPSTG